MGRGRRGRRGARKASATSPEAQSASGAAVSTLPPSRTLRGRHARRARVVRRCRGGRARRSVASALWIAPVGRRGWARAPHDTSPVMGCARASRRGRRVELYTRGGEEGRERRGAQCMAQWLCSDRLWHSRAHPLAVKAVVSPVCMSIFGSCGSCRSKSRSWRKAKEGQAETLAGGGAPAVLEGPRGESGERPRATPRCALGCAR